MESDLTTPAPPVAAPESPVGQISVEVHVVATGDPRDAEDLAHQVVRAMRVLIPKIRIGIEP